MLRRACTVRQDRRRYRRKDPCAPRVQDRNGSSRTWNEMGSWFFARRRRQRKILPKTGTKTQRKSHGYPFSACSQTICLLKRSLSSGSRATITEITTRSSLLLLAAVVPLLVVFAEPPRPIRWHDSMYYEGSYFWQLFHDTQVYTRRATSIYCGPPARYVP